MSSWRHRTGSVHRIDMDFDRIFGRAGPGGGPTKLQRWRRAMNVIATGGDGEPNTFRHRFVLDRGLLEHL